MPGTTTELTLALIKPDAVQSHVIGRILTMMESEGFRIRAMRMDRLDRERAAAFYEAHREKAFYEGLIEFMISGPIVAIVLEAPNAIERWRRMMGPTKSSEAPHGSVRRLFGTTERRNATHGSDTPESANREIGFFFGPGNLY